jgi:hypothetical protein
MSVSNFVSNLKTQHLLLLVKRNVTFNHSKTICSFNSIFLKIDKFSLNQLPQQTNSSRAYFIASKINQIQKEKPSESAFNSLMQSSDKSDQISTHVSGVKKGKFGEI